MSRKRENPLFIERFLTTFVAVTDKSMGNEKDNSFVSHTIRLCH